MTTTDCDCIIVKTRLLYYKLEIYGQCKENIYQKWQLISIVNLCQIYARVKVFSLHVQHIYRVSISLFIVSLSGSDLKFYMDANTILRQENEL